MRTPEDDDIRGMSLLMLVILALIVLGILHDTFLRW